MFWSCVDTNTVNVTRIGSDLLPVGAVLVGSEERRPRFLAIHPPAQLLFLSVAGEFTGEEGGSRIDKIDLTSGEDRVLVTSDIGAVSGMTVDWEQEGHLYWADIVNKKIEAVSLAGEDRRLVISEGVEEIVGLSVQGAWLYWADRHQAVIVRVDKLSGTRRQVVLSKVSRLSSLMGVSRLAPPLLAPNPCQAATLCSHFCSFKLGLGASCGCPPEGSPRARAPAAQGSATGGVPNPCLQCLQRMGFSSSAMEQPKRWHEVCSHASRAAGARVGVPLASLAAERLRSDCARPPSR